MADLLDHVIAAGFPLDRSAVIHLFVGGSALHGAKIEGYDDLDIYGCYIEPPECILGIQAIEYFCWSSGSQGEKNTANDVDVTMYSLHRWAELMMKGNPAILHYLYASNRGAPSSSVWSSVILPIRGALLSKKSARQYLGFANSQRMRLTGERGMGRHGQRPDLVEKYGFDTKFAMHYVRLLYECRELLRDKRLTLPLPEKDLLIAIRTGHYSQDEVFAIGDDLRIECEKLMDNSDLPELPDVSFLSRTVADAYLMHWTHE
jgi:predicted nucleotidyltransferase